MEKRAFIFFIVFIVSIFFKVHAVRLEFDEFFSLVMNYLGEDERTPFLDVQDLEDKLLSVYDNPLNWNSVTRDDLEDLEFVSDAHIEELLFYADCYGPVRSIAELRLVENIDAPLLLLLPSVLYVGEVIDSVKWSDAFDYTKHKIVLRTDYTPELREGFVDKSFYGANFRLLTRYNFNASDNFKIGFSMESDPGEPWFSHNAKGFDLYRFYAQFSNLPYVGKVILGAYKADFGQGLLFGQKSYGSRMHQVLNISSSESSVSGYGGTSEVPTLLGSAISVPFRRLKFSLFYGITYLDADTSGGMWSSYSESGYHRTEKELQIRRNLSLNTVGANLSYNAKWYNFGVTAYGGIFSLPAVIGNSDRFYNDFYGKYQWGVSVDYGFKRKGIRFVGETAMSQKKGISTINSFQIYILPELFFSLNYRYFSPTYHSFWADVSSSMSGVNGEHGASFAMQLPVGKSKKLSFLADVYKSLYPTVHTPISLVGYELRGEFSGAFRHVVNLYFSLRYKSKPVWIHDNNYYISGVSRENVGHAFLKAVYLYGHFKFSSGIQSNLSYSAKNKNLLSLGWLIYQDISYEVSKIPLRFKSRLAIYESPKWANRFYLYESDVPESGYSPALYGSAFRWYLMSDYKFKFGLTFSLRLSQTIFLDRQQIGSGLDMINSNHKTDIHLHMVYLIKNNKKNKY